MLECEQQVELEVARRRLEEQQSGSYRAEHASREDGERLAARTAELSRRLTAAKAELEETRAQHEAERKRLDNVVEENASMHWRNAATALMRASARLDEQDRVSGGCFERPCAHQGCRS